MRFEVRVIVNNPVPPGSPQDKSNVLVGSFDSETEGSIEAAYARAVEVRDSYRAILTEMMEHFIRQPMPRGWAPFAFGTTLTPIS